MNDAQLGQRWISENETELGLGIVVASDLRTITLLFPGLLDPNQIMFSFIHIKNGRS